MHNFIHSLPFLLHNISSTNNLSLEARVGIGRQSDERQGYYAIFQVIQADCVTIGTAGFHLVC